MFHVVLFEPEIPPNTGNIMRLCANTGAQLHLVEPIGFELDDKKLRRAGLDYREWVEVVIHTNWSECTNLLGFKHMWALTTKATRSLFSAEFGHANGPPQDEIFVFGPETRGLPPEVLSQFSDQRKLRLPMREDSRSMNLSNTVAVVLYEAWRQQGFVGI